MIKEDPFNPEDIAAAITGSPKPGPKPKPVNHAAVPPNSKPVADSVKKATVSATTNFPAPGDPYWKQHPLQTQHGMETTDRLWGGDSTKTIVNPNILPQLVLPPPIPINKTSMELSDKARGYSNRYSTKNDQMKGKTPDEIKSNNYR